MSGPNPIYVDFVARGTDNVLKALKSISDAVNKSEATASNAVKTGASARAKEHEKEVKAAAKACADTSSLIQSAERTNSQFLSKELRTRLQNQTRHLLAVRETEQSFNATRLNNALRHIRQDFDARQSGRQRERQAAEASQAAAHASAEAFWKREISLADAAAKRKASIRENSANTAGRFARQEAARESSIKRQFEREEKKVRNELLSGAANTDVKLPVSLSPQARLLMLQKARNGTPDEQKAAIERVRDMRDESRARLVPLKKELVDHLHIQKEMTRQEEAEGKRRLAIRENSAKMAGRFAAQQAREEARARAKVLAEEEARAKKDAQKREQFGKTVYGMGGRAMQAVTTVGGAVARGFANIGGGFSIEDSVNREVSFQGRAASIAATTNTGISESTLMSSARAVAIKEGLDKEEVLRGYEAVKKLDDKSLPVAIRSMPRMAELATATGTDLGHLGDLAANITAGDSRFAGGIDKDLGRAWTQKETDDNLMKQLRIFTRQGIEGGVEVSDFARYGSRITAGAGVFGGDKLANEATLGGAAQLARQRGGAASPAEAALAAQRFGTDLQKKAGYLKDEFKIDVSDGKGGMRNAEDILVEMVRNESDVTKIKKFKLGERGDRVLTGAADLYREAGGGDAGEKALRSYFANQRKEISEQEVKMRADKRRAAIDKQVTISMENLRNEVGTKLVPALIPLVQQLTNLMPTISMVVGALGKLAEFIANNPIAGLGALVLGFFTKELLAAQISSTIQKLIANGGKPLGGEGGAGSAVAAGAAAGYATYTLFKPGVDSVLGGQTSGQMRTGEYLSRLKGHSGREDQLAAAAEIQKMQAQYGGAKGAFNMVQEWGLSVPGSAYSAISGDKNPAGEALSKTVAAREVISNEEIRKLVAALNDNTRAVATNQKAALQAAPPQTTSPTSPNRGLPISRR